MAPRSLSHDRYSFANLVEQLELPDLIAVQRESFDWFMKDGLAETFADISDRKSTRLNSSHSQQSRMPSSA